MGMHRFMGMMPSYEVSISKHYVDQLGLKIMIQAGNKGWTIIYSDNSTKYEDVNDSPENNFKKAYDIASNDLGPLKEKNVKNKILKISGVNKVF